MRGPSASFTLAVLVICLWYFPFIEALVPVECVGNVTNPSAVCCPRNPENYQVCGGPSRGYCTKIVAPVQYVPIPFHMDDRVSWPNRFFSFACQCRGNFFGTSCQDCWFGWTGPNCDIPVIKVRKDIRDLTTKERRILIDVLARSSHWPSGYALVDETDNFHSDPLNDPRFVKANIQYYVAYIHRYGSRTTLYKTDEDCNTYGMLDFIHDGPGFATWHRYFTLLWEQMLGKIAKKLYGVENFSVPYWDWVGMRECDVCTNEFIGAPGNVDEYGLRIHEGSPFSNWTEYCYEPNNRLRCYGCQHAGVVGKLTRRWRHYDFPDQSDIGFLLGLKDFYVRGERDSTKCTSFSMALEGFCGRSESAGPDLWMHNKVHNMVDGSMCCVGTAANDPLFLLHHIMVDKIFTAWYQKYDPPLTVYPQQAVRPGHCRDCFMPGFFPLARNADMFTDTRNLGYVYVNSLFGVRAQNGRPPISASMTSRNS
ncbi:unnamed protein product [Schistocephalus solidus]|uniref:Tyrosinase_Cu-bd domain-containing protein n=1 Tax=Schistocephalus solidus TaxID=70667 RepID=A0A183TCN8_SCHSO|nr:unnamed protein product [Schistocephalus solidus]